jgi:hypothetical protein
MGKSAPKPPPVPDPTAVANAQSDANIKTAEAQQKLNMVNSYGPNGSVTYQTDANAPGGYSQTTTLSPAEQAIFDKLTSAQSGALDIGNAQLGRVSDALATPLSTAGLPELQGGATPGQVQTSFGMGQPLQYGFNPGQAVQGHVQGGGSQQAINDATNAVYNQATSRLDPQWNLRQQQLTQQLADQGISQGSDAYSRAMDQFSRDRNDAYTSAMNSAITSGQNEQNVLFGQNLGAGQFANQAAAQMYAQNQGQAAFHNATAAQDYGQNLGAAQFANAAQNQQFNQQQASATLSDQARQQGLNERAYLQNQPINQLTGLMSLGQVANPQGISYTPSQVGQTDVIGANALATQAANANYQAQMAQNSGLMGGLFSLGSAAIMASDRRLKRDIVRIGELAKGVGLYLFRYVDGDRLHVGVMAQELKRVRPDLVLKRADGFLAVDYAGLGMI